MLIMNKQDKIKKVKKEVVTKFNALLADLKAKGYMEADAAQ